FIEITSRDASLTGESVCALKIRPGLNVAMKNVAVRGTVLGVAQEEGVWQFPRNLQLDAVGAGMPHEFRLKLVVPVPCKVASELGESNLAPIELDPSEVSGPHTKTIRNPQATLKVEQPPEVPPPLVTTPMPPAAAPQAGGPDVLVVSAYDGGQFRTIGEALQRA